jgi:MGT family glycosyltransferase
MPFAGHVAPVFAVAEELHARGHDVTVYTGSRYLQRFRDLGVAVIPWREAPDFDENDLQITFPATGRRGPRGLLANVEHIFVRTAVGQARDLMAAHAETPFDLIAGDVMALGTGLAAVALGVPWATLSIVPLSLPSRDLPPNGLALQPGHGPLARTRNAALRLVTGLASRSLERAHREVRSELGLPPTRVGIDSAWYSPSLVVASGGPSIEYRRTDLGAQFHFVGRFARKAASGADKPEWWPDVLAATEPIVLVTQGTFNTDPSDLIEPALTALASEPALVLATIDGADLAIPRPANTRTAGFLPFADVLPRIAVAITNGGWGGVLEMLENGLPLIVAGGDLDKPEIAARVAWSGAGIDLRTGTPTSDAVRRAYLRLIGDPAYAARARRIGDELASLGGVGHAIELLERLIETGKPVLAPKNPWG